MVAIPTILHLGNDEIQGATCSLGVASGKVPVAVLPLPGGWTYFLNKKKLNWVIPWASDGSGSIDLAVPYQPWFDRTLAAGLGEFTPYHVVNGILPSPYAAARGDNSNGIQDGFGSSAWLMHRFAETFTTAPYFKYLKLMSVGSMADSKIGGSSYNDRATLITRAKSLVSPDTLEPKLIIIDTNGDAGFLSLGVGGDIQNIATVGATYKADLIALINQYRNVTFSAPNALVVLICHAPSYLQTSGGAAGSTAFAAVNKEIANELSNVATYQMSDEDLAGTNNSYGQVALGNDRFSYQADAYIRQGEDIYQLWKTWGSRSSRPLVKNSIPTILTVGDSQSVIPISAEFQEYNPSAGLYGISKQRPNQWIYNDQSELIEKITIGISSNMNTAGSVTNKCGPIYSMSDRFGEYYPDGVLFIHMGKSGSAVSSTSLPASTSGANGRWLKSAAENYPVFEELVQNARGAAFTQTANSWQKKVPVTHLIVIQLGDNDSFTLDDATRYKPSLINLIKSMREDFGFEIYGMQTPVILVKIGKESFLGTPETRKLIRQSQEEIVKEIPNVGIVRTIEDYDLSLDNIHHSSELSIAVGRDIFTEYVRMTETAFAIP